MDLDYFKHTALKDPLAAEDLAIKFNEFKQGLLGTDEILLLVLSKALSELNFIFSSNDFSMDIHDDAVSNTCLEIMLILKDSEKVQTINNPAAYFARVVYYGIIDLVRAQANSSEVDYNPYSLVDYNLDGDKLDIIDTVQSLSQDALDDSIIQLRLENRSQSEVAQILQVPSSTVSQRLQKLRTKYYNSLEE